MALLLPVVPPKHAPNVTCLGHHPIASQVLELVMVKSASFRRESSNNVRAVGKLRSSRTWSESEVNTVCLDSLLNLCIQNSMS